MGDLDRRPQMPDEPALQVRRATLDDLPAIHALGDEVCDVHRDARPDVFAGAGAPGRDDARWREAIAGDDARAAFVAERGGAIVGFVTARVLDEPSPMYVPVRACEVGALGVAAAARGQGVGRTLMTHVEAWARAAGAAEMHLVVWRFNERAARLYAELGYEARSTFMARRL
jgi:ribosomal protein S18 acetylase RimI-like enzyme